MAKEEKGFFDGLVDDFCRDLELKAAIEASRDENGNVDKWAATGAAFGLGHTSDDDIAMLGAMLGAEGAFDPDKSKNSDLTYSSSLNSKSSNRSETTCCMSETEYEQKKRDIVDSARASIGIIAVVAVVIFIAMLLGVAAESGVSSVVCIGFLIVALWGIWYFSNQKHTQLQRLEAQYAESRNVQAQVASVKDTYDSLKNYCGTNDLCDVLTLVYKKANRIMDTSDMVCGIRIPTYDRGVITALLNSILYFTIKECELSTNQKSALYDLAASRCGTNMKGGFTGDLLFLKYDREIDESMCSVLNEVLAMITVAASKSGISNAIIDYVKTICSWILLLDENLKKDISVKEFGEKGVHIVLSSAQIAARIAMST